MPDASINYCKLSQLQYVQVEHVVVRNWYKKTL